MATSMFQLSEKEYKLLSGLIYDIVGINLGPSKQELLRTRVGKRLRHLGIPTFKEYYKYVTTGNQEELTHLFDAISTNLTSFFREKRHFDFLTEKILPGLIEKKKSEVGGAIRIWSSASSTGEEAYSIAMTIYSFLKNSPGPDIKILATDISTKVLDTAGKGVYREERVKNLPKNILNSCFLHGHGNMEGYVKVKQNIREMVVVRRLNLMSSVYPFKRKFDFIFCRNVLIYFDKGTQTRIVNKLYANLAQGGHLFLGHAESLNGVETDLSYVEPTIYQKR